MASSQKLSYYSGGPSPHSVPSSYWEWLSTEARKRPSALAFKALHQPPEFLSGLLRSTKFDSSAEDHLSWSFAQLLEAVEVLAASWFAAGVRPKHYVYTFTANGAESCVLSWAAARLGAALVSMDPTSLKRDAEMRFVTETLEPAIVFVDTNENAILAEKYVDNAKVKLTSSLEDGTAPGWRSLQSIVPDGTVSPAPQPPTSDPDDTTLVLFTSGSTGLPKMVPKSLRNWTTEVDDYRSFAGANWSSDSRVLIVSNNFRPIYCIGACSSWRGGGSTVIPGPRFDQDTAFQAAVNHNCTNMIIVPSSLKLLISVSKATGLRFSSVHFTSVSGDLVDASLLEEARAQLGIKRVVGAWGMTETHPVFGWQVEESAPITEHNVVGVGRPLPGSSAKVCEAGTTSPVPCYTAGELHVQSTTTISAYGGKSNKASGVFYTDEQGRNWFNTNDLAVMDHSGVVSIVGRTKDMIKVKGNNIIPSIFEDYIRQNFGHESKVIGIPDELNGNICIAITQGECDETTVQRIKSESTGYLGLEYIMEAIYALAELGMDDWPRNSSEKIDKAVVRDATIRFHGQRL